MRRLSLFILSLMTLLCTSLSAAAYGPSPVRGMAITSWGWDNYGYDSAKASVNYAISLGANAVSFSTETYVNLANDTVYDKSTVAKPLSQPNANLTAIIRYAKSKGLKVAVKPHFLNDRTNDMLGGVAYTPKSLDRFFSTLEQSLLAHARVAASAGADILYVGTEFGQGLTGKYRDRWATIIKDLRLVFRGTLSYSSLFYADSLFRGWGPDEARLHCFWDLLDLIGIDLYPSLSRTDLPTATELVGNWTLNFNATNTANSVVQMQKAFGKPVVFSEIGFRSQLRGAQDTGYWTNGLAYNEAIQVSMLQAAQQIWRQYGSTWLTGFFYWDLPAGLYKGGTDDLFSVYGKQGAKALQTWYRSF